MDFDRMRDRQSNATELTAKLARATSEEEAANLQFQHAAALDEEGEHELAATEYIRRGDLDFSSEEKYLSLYRAGLFFSKRDMAADRALLLFERASAVLPARAEALHAASCMCRNLKRYSEGYQYASRAATLSVPDGSFVEEWIYRYGILDELAVNAYWTGRFEECKAACLEILAGNAPEETIRRVQGNLALADEKLNQQALVPVDGGTVSFPPPPEPQLIRGIHASYPVFKTIHIVWIGDQSRCPKSCIDSWRAMNPSWSVKVWGNDELSTFNWKTRYQLRKLVTWELNAAADVMRWEILEALGGFAVDADSRCIRALEDWLFEASPFACWENERVRPGLVAAGYVYARPGDRLISRILQAVVDDTDITGDVGWEKTGPQLLTDVIANSSDTTVTVYPSHFFIPKHYDAPAYTGSGPVFAEQYWGSKPGVYERLASE